MCKQNTSPCCTDHVRYICVNPTNQVVQRVHAAIDVDEVEEDIQQLMRQSSSCDSSGVCMPCQTKIHIVTIKLVVFVCSGKAVSHARLLCMHVVFRSSFICLNQAKPFSSRCMPIPPFHCHFKCMTIPPPLPCLHAKCCQSAILNAFNAPPKYVPRACLLVSICTHIPMRHTCNTSGTQTYFVKASHDMGRVRC